MAANFVEGSGRALLGLGGMEFLLPQQPQQNVMLPLFQIKSVRY